MESNDSYAAALSIAKHKTNRAIEHLMGLVTGLVADGHLNDLEIKMLSSWIANHPEVTSEFPGSVIARKIAEVLADGVITEDERTHLLETLLGLASTDFSATGSAASEVASLPIDDAVSIDLRDLTVCFTGEFVYGTRAACEKLMAKVGSRCASDVSKKVNVLVIGTRVSPDWAHTSFGRKIQKAAELREEGHGIHIISERRWQELVV
jgi:NAD-dependent DNA ligase